MDIPKNDPRAVAVTAAIHNGDLAALETMLKDDPELASARIVDEHTVRRSLLHIATDWPGRRPNSAQTIAMLVRYGADVNASVDHPSQEEAKETPLHWAASNDDVESIDALLDAGADIEVPGAIFTSGAPMSDAVIFAQWKAARRLHERGAKTTFWQASALGLLDEVQRHLAEDSSITAENITNAFWNASRGGHRPVAEFLLSRGADPNWIGHDDKTSLEMAMEGEHRELVDWLQSIGAKKASEL